MSAETPRASFAVRRWWVFSLYFAEGFPYALVRQLSTVFFKDAGASLQAVGLTSLYGLPWTLKLLWAPLVDTYATKRRWLVTAEAALTVLVALLALASASHAALAVAAGVFFAVAIASATHDIAIDGYYLEALDRDAQARFVGVQAMSYRIALISGGGGVIALSGWSSWPVGLGVAATGLGALCAVHGWLLPVIETPRRPAGELGRFVARPRVLGTLAAAVAAVVGARWLAVHVLLPELAASAPRLAARLQRVSIESWIVLGLGVVLAGLAARAGALRRRLYSSRSTYALAFVDYLDQPRIGVILAFILLYRVGESFLLNMAYPFLSGIGVSRAAYGIAYGTFGVSASIAGGLLGGFLIGRLGLRRCIWPLAVAQNGPNLLYVLMAMSYPAVAAGTTLGASDLRIVTALIVLEQLGAGLGTSAFMVFIMRTTKPAYKAANMAVATGLMTVAATFAGVFSGFIADALGFKAFFFITFLATLPAMALIPWLPHLDAAPAAPAKD
ncbi:MAG TPA: MFS transporter [Thermoanaerobaculaceae bacterium]|nr:MFS transporter [Thermoanaerobaculaceae bacterium]HRS14852.1 MFS transporter [Thermoanaerobaculaceae bacterium]